MYQWLGTTALVHPGMLWCGVHCTSVWKSTVPQICKSHDRSIHHT